MAEQFTKKGNDCLECNDCGAGVRTDNLSEDQDVQSIHDSISGSCSSRSSSKLSDISDSDNVFFKQAADGIHEPNEETEKGREVAKPAPSSNKPIKKMTKQPVEAGTFAMKKSAIKALEKEMAEQFTEKGNGCLECNDCGAGVRTDNLRDDQDVQSIHDSISGSCSSRSSSRLSDISDTDNVFFKQAADGIHEPNEETEKGREAAKPAPSSNKPVRKMTKQPVEGKSKRELQEENTRLKLFDKCKVCQTNEAIVLVSPCNHLELCRPCAGNTEICPVCHNNISLKYKIMANRADNYQ